ncbi:hypothetical protein DI44_07685 [Geobacillus sp. CAMR5420]|nr:hypothetical protein I656_02630 [Geobacillus sp. WSUCF1]KDE49108.1 hypothetical protein DI44_07685 [Geobacillus sp. CAMR5420]OQP17564.1 hypothetical protein B1693_03570 [Geobacillus zalihae]
MDKMIVKFKKFVEKMEERWFNRSSREGWLQRLFCAKSLVYMTVIRKGVLILLGHPPPDKENGSSGSLFFTDKKKRCFLLRNEGGRSCFH